MQQILRVTDASPFYQALDEIVSRNKSDYIPYDGYEDPHDPDNIDIDFFANYRFDREQVLIATTPDEGIIGFACMDVNCEREDTPIPQPFTYLSLICIDEPYRNQGIGQQFYDRFLALRRHDIINKRLAFSTWESNQKQQYLSNKYGFREYTRKEEHRVNGDDTVYYVLSPETNVV